MKRVRLVLAVTTCLGAITAGGCDSGNRVVEPTPAPAMTATEQEQYEETKEEVKEELKEH